MQETRVIKKYSALEVLKLGKFKQVANEPVPAWLVRLWDTGVEGIRLTAVETEKLSDVTSHPSLRQRPHGLDSVMHRVFGGLAYVSHEEHLDTSVQSPHKHQELEDQTEGQVLLRDLGGRRAVFEPGSLGQIELCSQRRQREG